MALTIIFLLLNSYETEVHLSVEKASDRTSCICSVKQGFIYKILIQIHLLSFQKVFPV